jgi:hypothetical protein
MLSDVEITTLELGIRDLGLAFLATSHYCSLFTILESLPNPKLNPSLGAIVKGIIDPNRADG